MSQSYGHLTENFAQSKTLHEMLACMCPMHCIQSMKN